MKILLLGSSILLAVSSGTWAAEAPSGDAVKGESLFGICAGCHGANGEGSQQSNAPRLAGQHRWYLVTQLNNFRAGLRGAAEGDNLGAMMRSMSLTLEDEQAVQDVVAYIATFK